MTDIASTAILLVGGNESFCAPVKHALRAKFGHENVLCANDGLAGLKAAISYSIKSLIIDLDISDPDGIAFLAALSQHRIHVPVFAATSRLTHQSESAARSYGAIALVDKPVDVSLLLDWVDQGVNAPDASILSGVSLPGFAQLIALERKSCVVRAVDQEGRSGKLYFVDGELVDARTPTRRGDDAVLSMMRWRNTSLVFEPLLELVEETVHAPLEQLLVEGARLYDEYTKHGRGSVYPPAIQSAVESARRMLNKTLRSFRRTSVASSKTLQEHRFQNISDFGSPEEMVVPRNSSMKGYVMTNIEAILAEALQIPGAIGAAIVDYESGLTLGTVGNGVFNIDLAAAGNTEVVKSEMRTMESLGIRGGIEDILTTLKDQYHLIRPLSRNNALFFYLVIDRRIGNLGLARMELSKLEQNLEF